MTPRFSQRIGITPLEKAIQLEGMDDDLTNGLWNIIKMFVIDSVKPFNSMGERADNLSVLAKVVWHEVFKKPIDEISGYSEYNIEQKIRDWYFGAKWFERYNLLEFLAEVNLRVYDRAQYIKMCNRVLEREFSGWRFIDGRLAPISNQTEVNGLTEALEQTQAFSAMQGANVHLTKALAHLSDRKEPDFRNSIKESIQAVEAIARLITKESTLGKALNALEANGVMLDIQLKVAFEKLYAWTNNKESGIRHAIIDEHKKPDFDDAKFMLITCSAFVNFLIAKANASGIPLKGSFE